jgi:predicted O-methyltransferase YrrM
MSTSSLLLGLLALLPVAVIAVAAVAALTVRRRLQAMDEKLAAIHGAIGARDRAAAVQADTAGAVIRQLSASVTTRVDALADWIARGATPESRAVLAREMEERDFFVETLSEGRIRVLQLAQLFPGIEAEAVPLGAIDPDTKHPNQVDMLYVCAIARHRRARRIFEFGTYLGRTTYHLALGKHARDVFTLDLDPAADYTGILKIGRAVKAVHERGLQGHFFQGTAAAGKIRQLHGDSRTFDYAPYAGSMDLVFVDGGHTYEMVVNDTDRAMRLMNKGGVVIWHDFAPKGRDVAAFAREFARARPVFWIEDTSLLVYIDGVDATTFDAPAPAWSRTVIKPE